MNDETTMPEETIEPVDYSSKFSTPEEAPVEEAPVEEAPVEEAPVEEAIEEMVETVRTEPVADSELTFVRPNLGELAEMRVRESADIKSDVVGKVSNQEKLRVLDNTHPEWTFVEALVGDDPVRGYVRKKFLVADDSE